MRSAVTATARCPVLAQLGTAEGSPARERSSPDWLAEEAVIGELFSSVISLILRENTGNLRSVRWSTRRREGQLRVTLQRGQATAEAKRKSNHRPDLCGFIPFLECRQLGRFQTASNLSPPGDLLVGIAIADCDRASTHRDRSRMRPAGTEDADLGLESDLRAAVQGLLAGASLEITPTEAKRISSFRPLLEPGTRVYLTHVPGHSIEDTLTAATRLHNDDIVPVAHIAARRFPNRTEVESVLGRLRAAGCDEALVIAGGDASAAGDFSSALDLLATGALEKAGFSHIAVAGHPEGSPAASQDQLWHALNQKNAHALSSSAKFHVVSQFCFDAKTIGAWEKEARLRGNRLAIHVGVPGLTSVPKLLKYAALCGVGASASFLRHSSLNMLRLARWQPDTLICQLAQQALSDPASLIRRIHFFPFGAVAETVAWMRQVQRGNFRFRKDWSGLVVE